MNSIFALSFIFIPILAILKYLNVNKKTRFPPGPYPWPVFGNYLQMSHTPHVKLASMARRYGPIMSFRVGTRLVVVGSTKKAAAEILKKHDGVLSGRHLFYSHPSSSPAENGYYVGFASECDDRWKHLRSVCRAGLFSARAIDRQAEIREKNVAGMVAYLHAREGEVVDMTEVVSTVALNTMCNVLFSGDVFGFGPGAGAEYKELIGEFLGVISASNIADLFPVLHKWDIQGMQKKAKRINQKIFGMWQQILQQRRERRRKSDEVWIKEDFLDSLIEIGLTDDHINHLLAELLLAGSDTTATAITWTLADLITNKQAMSKLVDELSTKLGKETTVRDSAITGLPYLQACLRESMRLHPPIPFLLPRRATKTCKVMDYIIPEDSRVIINTWAMARDPSIWDEPSSFKPERFLDSGLDFKGNDFEYVPLGSGRRMCPGLPMVARKVPYVVASLVHSFNWVRPGSGFEDTGGLEIVEAYGLSLRQKQPLELIPRACRRNND